MMNNKLRPIVLTAIILYGIQAQATDGINLIGIGPVQKGTAGAGMANGDDTSWLIVNPASLCNSCRRVDVSLELFAPHRTIESTVCGGAGKQTDDSFFVIPSVSSSLGCWDEGKNFLGVGIYGTSGMGVDYDDGRIGADMNQDMMPDTPQHMGDTMTALSVAKMNLVYAHRFENGFQVGAGPVGVLSRLKMDMFDGRGFSSGEWDTSTGIGGIIGVEQRIGKVSLGASYLSEQYMQKFDKYDTAMPDSLNLPQEARVGISYWPLENIQLALDYEHIDWNGTETFGDQFGWDSQNIVKAGITVGVTEKLKLRTGISHGNSPITSDNAFSNALFPAIMKTHAACGASYEWGDFSFHFAYVHAFKESVTANGKDMAAQGMGNFGKGTKIEMYQNSLSFGVGYKF